MKIKLWAKSKEDAITKRDKYRAAGNQATVYRLESMLFGVWQESFYVEIE